MKLQLSTKKSLKRHFLNEIEYLRKISKHCDHTEMYNKDQFLFPHLKQQKRTIKKKKENRLPRLLIDKKEKQFFLYTDDIPACICVH